MQPEALQRAMGESSHHDLSRRGGAIASAHGSTQGKSDIIIEAYSMSAYRRTLRNQSSERLPPASPPPAPLLPDRAMVAGHTATRALRNVGRTIEGRKAEATMLA